GVESLTLDGIDHGNEILFLVQIVRRIDLVDALILRDERGGGRDLLHIDGEEVTLVVSRPLTCCAIRASCSCERRVRLTRCLRHSLAHRRRSGTKPTILLTCAPEN